MQINSQKPSAASSVDSYAPTLKSLIKHFKLSNYFEWGSGLSTQLCLSMGMKVTSVENDPVYMEMVKRKYKVSGANFQLETDRRFYPYVNGDDIPYDLILVDGRMRNECLAHARLIIHHKGFVVLHDAERPRYSEAISKFKHAILTDDGHTATMTDNYEVFIEARRILSPDTV